MARYPAWQFVSLAMASVLLTLVELIPSVSAVPIADDPNGFETIPWGSILAEVGHFVLIEDAGRLQTYELTGQIPMLGANPVDSLRFTTFEKN